ncbi:GT4 family glycosyltransferase PelF [Aliifodinibius sp. S!AR15-10]|uniref:GT4 family glycosyltransferase PelF n=1 Tax=Aliifodinibius sp. S!AR15-10 TaxID=2950437 RepID=UPI002859ACF2|nr:GT4 family glycosyltransferase PelF [Aliifodinibius sp. S!AR15-10]MDR8391010.1 GT4 family glycosyltransferase PelF [Aliifodinibius sp. S!AR15-10]
MSPKPHVLFQTEGSYPYSGGGVSTWSHMLCTELREKVDFTLFAITGSPVVETRYRLTENVKSIIHVPLWGAEEPVQYFYKDVPFSRHIQRRGQTNDKNVKKYFFPLFRDFVDGLMNPFGSAREFGEIVYGFWKYYRHFDYKQTLRNPLVWLEFKKQLSQKYQEAENLKIGEEPPRVFDVTFGMRWLYHFLMALAVPVPDVSLTHATIAGFPAITSIAAKYEYGIPSLLTDHGVFIRERLINVSRDNFPYFSKKLLIDLGTFITRAAYYHADQISPVTSVNKKWEQRYEADDARIEPIYNGVDTDLFKPTPKPPETEGTPTVVAAAHVFPLKDIETMIRCCDLVRREIPNVRFVLYGGLDVDPDYTEKCRKLVKKLNVGDNFKFGGFHNAPQELFNEGDISILSSISEGFPYTVIESMSCARPVVATDVGGIREALEGCGELCRPRDPQSLADGVIKLLMDDDLRISMGRKARERVLLKYTIEKSVNSYYETYQRMHQQQRQPLKQEISLPSVKQVVELEPEYV